jgi:type I protein arginine methyltransferase
MYSLSGYGEMIADRVRMSAYAQALRQSVKPGSVVLDIGTGPGIFAILACQLGARRVFAIESDEIIQVARQNALVNHFADRIEFIEDLSTRVNLPEKADVIVSDLRGLVSLFGHHLPSIIDARRRFLAPGGVLIPRVDTLWAAIVEAPQRYAAIVEPWEDNKLDQDLTAARQLAVHNSRKARAKPEELLTTKQLWKTLDFATIETPDVNGELNWTVDRTGLGHGINVWFDTELADGVSFSNAPGAPETIYGSLFLPWIHPIQLTQGEHISVQLHAKLVGDDYLWRWTTQVKSADRPKNARIQFDQSTLAGAVISPAKMRKLASDFIPQLSDDGLLDRRILEMMDGRATLEQIAKHLSAEFPQRFARWQDALSSAGVLSRKYSR